MKQLNTLPIEDFLDKARLAIKSNKKDLTLSIKEATDLQNSLSVVMTRLAGELDEIASTTKDTPTIISMDGGTF
jgi:hypothetical protein